MRASPDARQVLQQYLIRRGFIQFFCFTYNVVVLDTTVCEVGLGGRR